MLVTKCPKCGHRSVRNTYDRNYDEYYSECTYCHADVFALLYGGDEEVEDEHHDDRTPAHS